MEGGPLALLLAHQGGWDEMLLVVGPLVLIALVLRAANRRAGQQLQAPEERTSGHRA
jgi:hypothetical protein